MIYLIVKKIAKEKRTQKFKLNIAVSLSRVITKSSCTQTQGAVTVYGVIKEQETRSMRFFYNEIIGCSTKALTSRSGSEY